MNMFDVVKRLAELDAQNPGKTVVESKPSKFNGTNAVTGLNKYTGEEVFESISVEELQQLSGIQECGMIGMPGAPMGAEPEHKSPASFSINASAATGDEVATMLGDILNLAGVQGGHDDKGPQPDGLGGHDDHLTGEPPEGSHRGAGDIQSALAAIDKIEADEADLDPTGADPMAGDMAGGTGDVGDMADQVRDMADELAGTTKDELGLEASRMFDNSPDEQTRAYDPNDFANVVNKIRSFDYSPARGGDNPIQQTAAESVEVKNTPEDMVAKLMADYKAFKA